MDDVLRRIEDAFDGIARPAHFTNREHCEECAEYDDLFAGRSLSTLQPSDFGRSGLWDPVCFLTDEGFLYFLPALARFACARGDSYCLDQLIFSLTFERIQAMSPPQREAVREFIVSVAGFLADEADIASDQKDIALCLERLAA